jgi:hypothetical protein
MVLCVNTALVFKLILSFQAVVPHSDIQFWGFALTCSALAGGCFFLVPADEGTEIKWGGRILTAGLPIAGILLAAWI